MKLNKKTISNILFFGFIIFLFTPFGLGTRAKLTQGITYVKTLIFSPSVEQIDKRLTVDTYDLKFKGIVSANDMNLESLKGKVVFINYWATWCPPCIAEMPMIHKLYLDYNEKLVFLFVTTDTKEKVEKFYGKNDYNFPTYNQLSQAPKQLEVSTIPTTFILDKNGKVALSEYGAVNWNSNSIRELLDKLIEE
ncbi:TlpA family protein disulfide reductase [Aureibaculum sp. A20]|uniref:TlpA family protein disulfide reductase n=1 Tax=Aureibaculum flavum TaxID=2795986 RepID=A0ABS0WLF8_9FLAO|nr:TlpA disulfide reductase family protein [Aureibaculum flavum]MBJ2172802.1 TlpA family protein disulfide reductase [Aureibaculum flavum]